MPNIIGQGISLRGMTHDDFHYPFYLDAAIVAADVGKAVAISTGVANTVRLAADGDQIVGMLVTVEDRGVEGVKVGTVTLRGGFQFTKTAAALTVGQSVVGAGAGLVKAAAAPNHADNIVVEVAGNLVTVIR